MVDASHIRKVYERYPQMVTSGDVDGIVGLYAEDAWIEDPIGSDKFVGHEGVRKFYESSAGSVLMKLTGPVRVAAGEAATPMVVLIGPEGSPDRKALDIISVMKFRDDGKVESMRAFWSMDAMRPASDADLAA
jgi:steroid delta-isomerase